MARYRKETERLKKEFLRINWDDPEDPVYAWVMDVIVRCLIDITLNPYNELNAIAHDIMTSTGHKYVYGNKLAGIICGMR